MVVTCQRWLYVLSVGVLALGCGGPGGDGPERYRISGTVNYNGQPLKAGSIIFDPDSAKGNSGPQGYASITDGNYDTNASGSAGTVGGPHKIRITGPGFEYQKPETIDLPKQDATQTFDIKEGDVTKLTPGPEV